ncbi:unnamed protein product, partial [Mesorhabditis belari]|uniref:Uncharacterized protein n=1 Tax=Mesorhabditis belari TaxID=2138241 RepID=A0AAF3FKB4_9BILA
MAPLRSLLIFLLGLLAISSVFAYPRHFEKRAMRNSLVRFGKRSDILQDSMESPLSSGREIFVVDPTLLRDYLDRY